MNSNEELNAMREQLEGLQSATNKTAKEIFGRMIAKIFLLNPDLEKFSFKAWTCYFNDGDELYYSVRADPEYDLEINDFDYPYDWEDDFDLDDKWKNLAEEISDTINQFKSDEIKFMFGDHVKIVCHRNGTIETLGYEDHD